MLVPQFLHRPLPSLEDLLGCKDCDHILSISKRRRTPQLDSGKEKMVEGTPSWNVGAAQTTLAPVQNGWIGHCPKHLQNFTKFAPDHPAERGFQWGSLKNLGAFLCYITPRQQCVPHHQWLKLQHTQWCLLIVQEHWLWHNGQSHFSFFSIFCEDWSQLYQYIGTLNELHWYPTPKFFRVKRTQGTM